MTPVDIVAAQLDAYNAQDLDALCACFAEDCVLAEFNGAFTQTGLAAVRERYASLFAQYLLNRARVLSRIVVGEVVIDHEDITRSADERFTATAIYTVRNGRIARVDFVRET